jgi:hypothetical protein
MTGMGVRMGVRLGELVKDLGAYKHGKIRSLLGLCMGKDGVWVQTGWCNTEFLGYK